MGDVKNGISLSHPKCYLSQPYQVAVLVNYNPDISYCGVMFLDKPSIIRGYTDCRNLSTIDIVWDKSPFDESLSIHDLKREYGLHGLHYVIMGPNPGDDYITCNLVRIDSIENRHSTSTEVTHSGVMLYSLDPRMKNIIIASYKRHFMSTQTDHFKSFTNLKALPRMCESHLAKTEDAGFIYPSVYSGYNIGRSTKDATMNFRIMPSISRIIINDPAVVVFWNDGTKTVGKCMNKDIFDPEIGLAMAISRKFYELLGFENPRGAFKQALKHAEDRSAKTKEKKERKQKLLNAAKEE